MASQERGFLRWTSDQRPHATNELLPLLVDQIDRQLLQSRQFQGGNHPVHGLQKRHDGIAASSPSLLLMRHHPVNEPQEGLSKHLLAAMGQTAPVSPRIPTVGEKNQGCLIIAAVDRTAARQIATALEQTDPQRLEDLVQPRGGQIIEQIDACPINYQNPPRLPPRSRSQPPGRAAVKRGVPAASVPRPDYPGSNRPAG